MTIRYHHDFPGSLHSDLPVVVFTFSVTNFSSGSTQEGVNWYMMLSVNFGQPQCNVVLSNWNIAVFAALLVAACIVLVYLGWILHAIWPGTRRITSWSDCDAVKATSCSTQCFPVVYGERIPNEVRQRGPDGEEIPLDVPIRPSRRATSMRRPRTMDGPPSRIIHVTRDPMPAPTIYLAPKGEKYHTDPDCFVFRSPPKAYEKCCHCIRKDQ